MATETDFAVHTRTECSSCMNLLCRCRICRGEITNAQCKMRSEEFPMSDACRWNTILRCDKYKPKEGK